MKERKKNGKNITGKKEASDSFTCVLDRLKCDRFYATCSYTRIGGERKKEKNSKMETKAWQGAKGKVERRTVRLLKEDIIIYRVEDSFYKKNFRRVFDYRSIK